jgi:hypothetical protein
MATLNSTTIAAGLVAALCLQSEASQGRTGSAHGALLVATNGGTVQLTSVREGVPFDLDGDGVVERVAWTTRAGETGFLAVDWNQNGKIDSGHELIGVASGPADGFKELAAYDGLATAADFERPRAAKRYADGTIDARDHIYERLILWKDRNHNGISEEDELESLAHAQISEIQLSEVPIETPDAHGNVTRTESNAIGLGVDGRKIGRKIAKVQLRVGAQ